MLHVLTSFYIAQEKEQFCTAAGNRRCKIISVRLPFWCRGKSAIKQSRIVDSLYANCNRSTHRTLCTERNAVGRRAVNINILIELGRPCVWKRRVNICLQSRISNRKDGAIFTPCRPACIVRCKVGVLKQIHIGCLRRGASRIRRQIAVILVHPNIVNIKFG